jgi:hypothetical protein
MCGAVAFGALLLLATIALVNLLVGYARLHHRLAEPAAHA